MTISSEIQKLQQNLIESYASCENKGATIPLNKNFDNLSSTIDSITTGVSIKNQTKNITENGVYTYDEGYTGLEQVDVNVKPNLISKSFTENGVYNPENGTDGYNQITINVKPNLISKSFTENGVYNPENGTDGYNQITINVKPLNGNLITAQNQTNAIINAEDKVWINYNQSSDTYYLVNFEGNFNENTLTGTAQQEIPISEEGIVLTVIRNEKHEDGIFIENVNYSKNNELLENNFNSTQTIECDVNTYEGGLFVNSNHFGPKIFTTSSITNASNINIEVDSEDKLGNVSLKSNSHSGDITKKNTEGEFTLFTQTLSYYHKLNEGETFQTDISNQWYQWIDSTNPENKHTLSHLKIENIKYSRATSIKNEEKSNESKIVYDIVVYLNIVGNIYNTYGDSTPFTEEISIPFTRYYTITNEQYDINEDSVGGITFTNTPTILSNEKGNVIFNQSENCSINLGSEGQNIYESFVGKDNKTADEFQIRLRLFDTTWSVGNGAVILLSDSNLYNQESAPDNSIMLGFGSSHQEDGADAPCDSQTVCIFQFFNGSWRPTVYANLTSDNFIPINEWFKLKYKFIYNTETSKYEITVTALDDNDNILSTYTKYTSYGAVVDKTTAKILDYNVIGKPLADVDLSETGFKLNNEWVWRPVVKKTS